MIKSAFKLGDKVRIKPKIFYDFPHGVSGTITGMNLISHDPFDYSVLYEVKLKGDEGQKLCIGGDLESDY